MVHFALVELECFLFIIIKVQFEMLVEHVFKKTITGKLLLTGIEDLVLESGLYGSLWNMRFDIVSQYVQQHSLIFDIWKYNTAHHILISSAHGELAPRRNGDKALMYLASILFPDCASLRAIQRVRMAAGVSHLSDICSADGRSLDSRYL